MDDWGQKLDGGAQIHGCSLNYDLLHDRLHTSLFAPYSDMYNHTCHLEAY